MKYYVTERNQIADAYRTAGIKARDDADAILSSLGFSPIVLDFPQDRTALGAAGKLAAHLAVVKIWKKALRHLSAGDEIVLQFPVINHSIFFSGVIRSLLSRGVRVTALIHDLEILRLSLVDAAAAQSWRLKREELSAMKLFSKIIVHNEVMKQYLRDRFGIDPARLVTLGIFDYLISTESRPARERPAQFRSVIVAGNLNPAKCAYVYDLPKETRFELYGPNYQGESGETVRYHGSFPPDELPFVLEGGFGLVWDGTSSESCCGVWGEYLKYNNPHKTSLYLASGIPVIIWDKAALAAFVSKNGVGITVSSLHEIPEALSRVSEQDYRAMCENAAALREKLTGGHFLARALKQETESF